ncbi:hypothetical protein GETHLI_33990 [Geothrix limicola]|uniref:Calcineurin-like phosphoesterase domain-containing protein n=1 Tax=Geothrix limicola TaxID=2927978 RepID=A0ABQ5QJW9_9BACT|nr:metallophosphatase domain-containing protein [Geothrix limicola]GLH74897.1 hypothetical protein GETHLI_33990 [Geothrix limicola]
MRLICISDTHNAHKGMQIPDGDVLIHAGDATGQGLSQEVDRFLTWFGSQPHQHKILIAGNHDWLFQKHPEMAAQLLAAHPGITYLQDSAIEIDGVKFWGSPWQPWFLDWAFNLPRLGVGLREVWSKIPLDTDVLITHGPPHGVLDQVRGGTHLGCEELKARLATVRPRIHIFGHIHDSYGVAQSSATTYINGCSCDEDYRPTQRPIVLDIYPASIKIHGIEPNLRLERLERIQAFLNRSKDDPREEAVYQIMSALNAGMRDMAEIRGTSADDLLQDYLSRGLQSDLAKQIRSESKPSKRAIPFTKLGDVRAEE